MVVEDELELELCTVVVVVLELGLGVKVGLVVVDRVVGTGDDVVVELLETMVELLATVVELLGTLVVVELLTTADDDVVELPTALPFI